MIMNMDLRNHTHILPLFNDSDEFNLNNALNHPERLMNRIQDDADKNKTAHNNSTCTALMRILCI